MSSALGCNCNPPNTDGVDYDDYTAKYTVGDDQTEASSTATDETEVLNQPYSKVTPLFRNIEKENWEGILSFLTTGKWSSGFFGPSNDHLRSPAPSLQVKTWITSYDRRGEPEWSQLPLHAALSYSAPYVVVQKLIEMYPKAIQCTDNEGMLPIHLAYGFGAQDNVLALLLEAFPTSANEKGLGGRYPYECCELGPNKARGKVFKIIADQLILRVSDEIDRDWKDFTLAAQDSVGITGADDIDQKSLHQFLLELLKDRKELMDIKRALRTKQQASAAKSPSKPIHQKVSSPRASSTPRVDTPVSKKSSKSRGCQPHLKALSLYEHPYQPHLKPC